MYMTATDSRRAIKINPVVPANESKILTQYSPDPVTNSRPIR
jgi:hypothetical protein